MRYCIINVSLNVKMTWLLAFGPNEYANKPAHPRSLSKLFAVRLKIQWNLDNSKSKVWIIETLNNWGLKCIGTSKWFWIIENFELLEFELSRFYCMLYPWLSKRLSEVKILVRLRESKGTFSTVVAQVNILFSELSLSRLPLISNWKSGPYFNMETKQ